MKIRDTKNIQRRQRTPSPNYSSDDSDDSSSDDNDYYDSNLNLINEKNYKNVIVALFVIIIISKLI